MESKNNCLRKKSPKKAGTAQRHMKRYFKRRVLEYVIMIQEWDYELSVDRSTQKNYQLGLCPSNVVAYGDVKCNQ
jgi:hypothetical protein